MKEENKMMRKWFGEWDLFEKSWLAVFTAINLYLFFAWDDTLLGLVSSLTGMMCVILVAKGKMSNYLFGIIQTSTYAYIAFGYGLYGEAMLNAFFYFPTQFIGLYMWNRNKHKLKTPEQGEDVAVKRLDKTQWIILSMVVVAFIGVYGIFLNALSGNNVWIDSTTNVLSVTAQILMLKRYAEQWALWILVNIFSIILWATALIQSGGNDISMLVMWTAFLVNSIYGYINWIKMSKKQEVK